MKLYIILTTIDKFLDVQQVSFVYIGLVGCMLFIRDVSTLSSKYQVGLLTSMNPKECALDFYQAAVMLAGNVVCDLLITVFSESIFISDVHALMIWTVLQFALTFYSRSPLAQLCSEY